jgi:glycerol-3-phosphate dehydrogenase
MAEVLGWSEHDIAREVEHYHGRVAGERRSQEQADDRAVDLERTSAPDVRARA